MSHANNERKARALLKKYDKACYDAEQYLTDTKAQEKRDTVKAEVIRLMLIGLNWIEEEKCSRARK